MKEHVEHIGRIFAGMGIVFIGASACKPSLSITRQHPILKVVCPDNSADTGISSYRKRIPPFGVQVDLTGFKERFTLVITHPNGHIWKTEILDPESIYYHPAPNGTIAQIRTGQFSKSEVEKQVGDIRERVEIKCDFHLQKTSKS